MSTDVRLMLGDCLELIREIDIRSVDAIVTDPPYGMNMDTNNKRFSGGTNHHRQTAIGKDWVEPVTGDDRPFDPSLWIEFPRVILWGSNHFSSSLPVGTTLVWVKRNEEAYGSFLSDAEIGWMKGGCGVYLCKDLSMNAIARERCHPCQKPLNLMKWCIERLQLNPGATILDPYMGSGTTGVAAVQLGFHFIGIESDLEHFATAERRIQYPYDKFSPCSRADSSKDGRLSMFDPRWDATEQAD